MTIPTAVQQMLNIVEQLGEAYPSKKFTLDGRLVGDIGEILVEEAYDVALFPEMQRHHDGASSDGRLVQIKASMKGSFTFPCDHIPNYYIAVQIHPNGTIEEIFNGPGAIAWRAVKNRKASKTNLHSISSSKLRSLQKDVAIGDKIPERRSSLVRHS